MKEVSSKKGLLFILILSCIQCTQKTAVNIIPTHPERGQTVVISYDCFARDAKIPADADAINLKFTYSTLYELPYTLPLQKKGDKWETSFTLPRYAVYATFYFEGGDSIDKPAPDKHYEIMVYDGKQPIVNAYLYKAYSLGAQMGKSDSLELYKMRLYEQELAMYPDNYEAKIQLLNYHIKNSEGAAREDYRKQAHDIIEARFHDDPNNMDNMNKVTMAYLILGERNKVDSIRQVALKDYPDGEVAKELYPSSLKEEKDAHKRIALLEAALKGKNNENTKSYESIHRALFKEYLQQKNAEKAVYHADKIAQEENPYTPSTRESLAEELVKNNIGLDAALRYAKQALDSVQSYPVGIIRYFKEYGYIPSYVAPDKRTEAINIATGNILSLIAVIEAKQGNVNEVLQYAGDAMAVSNDEKTLQNITQAYTYCNKPAEAIEVYKKLLIKNPANQEAQTGIRKVYLQNYGSLKGFEQLMNTVNAEWKKEMLVKLEAKRLHKDAPSLTGIVDLKGNPLPNDFIKDKVIFISFWATWCSPCMEEMPYIQKVYEKYKNNPKVIFMIVNSGARNTIEDAKAWVAKSKYTFPVYFAKDPTISTLFDFNVIPAIFVIDAKNKLQFKSLGFEGPTVESTIDLEIELLLNE